MVQSVFFSLGPPFTNVVNCTIFCTPLLANFRCLGIVIFHCDKRVTRVRHDIRLTAEVLDYSLTTAVSDCDHVERTSLLFTAVESQLSERQVCSQLIHGTLRQKYVVVIVADSPV